jgi:hypothetical protein
MITSGALREYYLQSFSQLRAHFDGVIRRDPRPSEEIRTLI